MIILAIDTGNKESGWCFVDEDLNPLGFHFMGKSPNKYVESLVYDTNPLNLVIVEDIASYGMSVGKEVFDTCKEVGRLEILAELRQIPLVHILRREEKLAICHSPKANDATIRRALIDMFAKHDFKNGKGTKANKDFFYGFKADIWSAFAVAVTWKLKEEEEQNAKI